MNATDKAEALRLKIDQRFRSGNSVPVERAYITAEEWEALRSLLSAQEAEPVADHNVEAVRTKLLDRSRRGIAKYGMTTERDDLSLQDWLVHMQEELLDAAVYIQAAMRKGQEPSAEQWRQAIIDYCYPNVIDDLPQRASDWIEQRARELARKGVGNG